VRPVEKMECTVVTFSKTGLIQISLDHFSPLASAREFFENGVKILTSWPQSSTCRHVSWHFQRITVAQ